MKKVIILTIALLFPLQAKAYTFISSSHDDHCDYFTYEADVKGASPLHQKVTFCIVTGQKDPRKVADKLAYNLEHPKPMTKKELKALVQQYAKETAKIKAEANKSTTNQGERQ